MAAYAVIGIGHKGVKLFFMVDKVSYTKTWPVVPVLLPQNKRHLYTFCLRLVRACR